MTPVHMTQRRLTKGCFVAVTNRQIPTPACCLATPSGCPMAVYLSQVYHSQVRCSNRCGANIPRRMEISSRIAACKVALQMCSPQTGSDNTSVSTVHRLTRSTLRWMRVCSSEASDLCIFFKLVVLMFPGMQIDFISPTGQHLVLLECAIGYEFV